MSATPNLAFPYPTPADPVALGANDIRALAEALDTFLDSQPLIQHGVTQVTLDAGSNFQIVYPINYRSGQPTVQASDYQPVGASSAISIPVVVFDLSPDHFSGRATSLAGAPLVGSQIFVAWIAIGPRP